jgi:hypothetical protein
MSGPTALSRLNLDKQFETFARAGICLDGSKSRQPIQYILNASTGGNNYRERSQLLDRKYLQTKQ